MTVAWRRFLAAALHQQRAPLLTVRTVITDPARIRAIRNTGGPMSSIWTLTVSFAGMTWRDLRELVSRANAVGIPDEEPVEFARDADFNQIGIVVDAPPIAEEVQ